MAECDDAVSVNRIDNHELPNGSHFVSKGRVQVSSQVEA